MAVAAILVSSAKRSRPLGFTGKIDLVFKGNMFEANCLTIDI